jgi:hypothetical protein
MLKYKGMSTYDYILKSVNKVRPVVRGTLTGKNTIAGDNRGNKNNHPDQSFLGAGEKNPDDSREELSVSLHGQKLSDYFNSPLSGYEVLGKDANPEPPAVRNDPHQNQEFTKEIAHDSARNEQAKKLDSKRSLLAQAEQKIILPPQQKSYKFTEDMSQDEKIDSLKNLNFLQLQQAFKTMDLDECKNENKLSTGGLGDEMMQSKVTNADIEKYSLKQSKSEGNLSRLTEKQSSRGQVPKLPSINTLNSPASKESYTSQQNQIIATKTILKEVKRESNQGKDLQDIKI